MVQEYPIQPSSRRLVDEGIERNLKGGSRPPSRSAFIASRAHIAVMSMILMLGPGSPPGHMTPNRVSR